MLRTFKDLKVWRKAYDLCMETYGLTKGFPAEERFGLAAQLRRSAVSVPSNIAEGYARDSTKDYVRFLWIASGSLAELEVQLLLARDLELGLTARVSEALERLDEVERMLRALIRSLEPKL